MSTSAAEREPSSTLKAIAECRVERPLAVAQPHAPAELGAHLRVAVAVHRVRIDAQVRRIGGVVLALLLAEVPGHERTERQVLLLRRPDAPLRLSAPPRPCALPRALIGRCLSAAAFSAAALSAAALSAAAFRRRGRAIRFRLRRRRAIGFGLRRRRDGPLRRAPLPRARGPRCGSAPAQHAKVAAIVGTMNV
jgi:hypothetical protein